MLMPNLRKAPAVVGKLRVPAILKTLTNNFPRIDYFQTVTTNAQYQIHTYFIWTFSIIEYLLDKYFSLLIMTDFYSPEKTFICFPAIYFAMALDYFLYLYSS